MNLLLLGFNAVTEDITLLLTVVALQASTNITDVPSLATVKAQVKKATFKFLFRDNRCAGYR